MFETHPAVSSPTTSRRMEHQRLRWRLMYGLGEADIRARLRQSLGSVRESAWGALDLTANPLLNIWSQAAATYRSEPIVYAPTGLQDVADLVAESGHWSLMQRVQRDALALREHIVRIDVDPEDPDAVVTVPVPPYLCEPVVDRRVPYRAVAMVEHRPDPDEDGKWVRIVTDPRDRVHVAFDADALDVSDRVLGGRFTGNDYPFVGPSGPILPYVPYRAALTGGFWDSFTGREMVETTLQLGLLYSFYIHIVKDASWLQRYAVGLEVGGAVADDESGRSEVVTDPATLLLLRVVDGHEGPVDIGQLAAAADPEAVLRSIQAYERRAVDAALGTANVSRSNSDIRSSFSLAVSRDEQRELQRSYEPVFRRSDLELLRKVSALMGVEAPKAERWRIDYRAIPRSPQESAAEMDRLTKAVEAGLMSRVEAYRVLHPQLTEAEALQAVEQIAQMNRRTAA